MSASQDSSPGELALADARRLAREGRHAKALERHRWYHDHALESAPSHYGVRLSFALWDWVKLGKVYPPALDALRAVRDKKTARLEEGSEDEELFHDVTAINHHLGNPAATVVLFKKIDTRSPAFASQLAWHHGAIEPLIEAREFPLLRKHLGDAVARLDLAVDHFQHGLEFARSHGDCPDSRRVAEHSFADTAVQLITVLRETGGREQARQIQERALAVFDDLTIRNALDN